MGTDSSIAINDATGTSRPVDAYVLTGGDYQQIVQEVRASAGGSTEVANIVTSSTILSADVTRCGVHFYNDSTSATVYVRLGAVAATLTSYSFPIPPQAYFDCPQWMTRLEFRAISTVASGNLHVTTGTIA
jgi:hypothetical protein